MNTNLGDVPMEPPPPEEDERRVRSTGATASSSTMSSSTTMTSNPTTTTGRPHFAPQAEEAQRRFRREQEEREEEEEEEEEELNQESDGESSHKSGDSNSAHVHSSSTGSSPSRTMPSVLRPPSISTQPQLGRPTYHLAPRTTSTPSTSFLTPPTYEQYEYGNMDNRGQKRRLNQTDFVPQTQRTMPPPPPPPSSDATSTRMGPAHDDDAADDPLHFETRGSHGPRDESRYETWTSKQLRKKCSHLKLRGLKNVKKHVMVEALYRFYRNQRSGGGGYTSTNTSSPSHPRYTDDAYFSHGSTGHGYASHPTIMHRGRASSSTSLPVDGSPSMNHRPSPSTTGHHKSLSPHRPTHPYHHASLQDDTKVDSFDNEVRITSDDVIRLVDVMLSSDFVDRLTSELSRWQFWVDVREKYIRKLKEQHEMDSYSAARGLTALGERDDALSRLPLTSYSRNARWSSMQLWEMWKELTFAYTKTCFEFTTAGMTSENYYKGERAVLNRLTGLVYVLGADECDYIHYCKGRPDVYYLHQRLHARPDLLHLIKSNEYIDEKHTGEDSNSTTAAMDVAVGSPAPPSTSVYATPTVESTAPAPPSSYNGKKKTTERDSSPESAVNASSSEATNPPPRTKRSNVAEAAVQYLRNNSPTEGSTENSETTGEDASMEKTNSNSGSRTSQQRGEELTEQKYFGLLLQNFEAIFESLHNKKVLLAALRKDKSAPDHLIADLHDDIHVLSALKKEFRSKLRQTLE